MPKNVKDRMEFMREARERFTLAQHADKEDRQEAIDETTFAAGEQWDEEARFARVAQNRPVMTRNRCGGFTQIT